MNRIDLEKQLIAKSSEDAAFRQQLIAQPREAIASVFGTELPAEVEVSVFEESPTRLCLVLPVSAETELSDADLSGVAGGRRSGVSSNKDKSLLI